MFKSKDFCHHKLYLSTLIITGLMASQPTQAMENPNNCWARIAQMIEDNRLTPTAIIQAAHEVAEMEVEEKIPSRRPAGYITDETIDSEEEDSFNIEIEQPTQNAQQNATIAAEENPTPQLNHPPLPLANPPHLHFHFHPAPQVAYAPIFTPLQMPQQLFNNPAFTLFQAPDNGAYNPFNNQNQAPLKRPHSEDDNSFAPSNFKKARKEKTNFPHIAITLSEVLQELSTAKFRPHPRAGEFILLKTQFFTWSLLVKDFEEKIIKMLPEQSKGLIEVLQQQCQRMGGGKTKEITVNQNLRKLYAIALNSGICHNSDQDLIKYIDSNKDNDFKNTSFKDFHEVFKHKVNPLSDRVLSVWDPIFPYLTSSIIKGPYTHLNAAEKDRAFNMLKCLQNGLHLQAPLMILNARTALQKEEELGIVGDVIEYILAFMKVAYLVTPVNPVTR